MVALLKETHGERPIARALTKDGAMIEILASQGGATWTIIITWPDSGIACLGRVGEGWLDVMPKPKKMGTRI